jgi:hypothetical protein
MTSRANRVLIVGRSGSVLRDAVALLRERGYAANASNQFDRLLDDYDMRDVDLVIFGGMVPPDKKEQLRAEIEALNPAASFLQGLGGIAPLLVAQVEQFFAGPASGIEYDAARRTVRLRFAHPERAVVQGLWAKFVPPEPIAQSVIAFEGELPAGVHDIAIPAEVPPEGSYAAVRVGGHVSAFRIGDPPESVRRLASAQALPAPEPVTTRLPWR